ncbi:hypothetical protein [Aureimonas phyllosphaerae]|uniref:Uncharacterized protein n=1 Tax=Aureimonas phyllosphaerae TaxID=1166078 RepID=A0A7W6C3F4_9HYPH|nr:hypothetical protein [Aureimonas phyllosphaerae]MBB3937737.1 hypothetical protein [Aureimonas phyllosphaerae]MBB3961728.1 hypothetical protein [Aureimonas phyllosphaerae]
MRILFDPDEFIVWFLRVVAQSADGEACLHTRGNVQDQRRYRAT